MKRVIVIGCPGSGKTTFAEKLNKITGLPLYHLDAIWHKPDKTHIPREEFDQRISEIFATDEWIIDGNYGRTVEMRLKECDTVFLFDLPTEVCLQGALSLIHISSLGDALRAVRRTAGVGAAYQCAGGLCFAGYVDCIVHGTALRRRHDRGTV